MSQHQQPHIQDSITRAGFPKTCGASLEACASAGRCDTPAMPFLPPDTRETSLCLFPLAREAKRRPSLADHGRDDGRCLARSTPGAPLQRGRESMTFWGRPASIGRRRAADLRHGRQDSCWARAWQRQPQMTSERQRERGSQGSPDLQGARGESLEHCGSEGTGACRGSKARGALVLRPGERGARVWTEVAGEDLWHWKASTGRKSPGLECSLSADQEDCDDGRSRNV
jgi:hypothetical protein